MSSCLSFGSRVWGSRAYLLQRLLREGDELWPGLGPFRWDWSDVLRLEGLGTLAGFAQLQYSFRSWMQAAWPFYLSSHHTHWGGSELTQNLPQQNQALRLQVAEKRVYSLKTAFAFLHFPSPTDLRFAYFGPIGRCNSLCHSTRRLSC